MIDLAGIGVADIARSAALYDADVVDAEAASMHSHVVHDVMVVVQTKEAPGVGEE